MAATDNPTSRPEEADPIDTSGSVPPPAARTASAGAGAARVAVEDEPAAAASAAAKPVEESEPAGRESSERRTLAEAEALAKVAAIAADGRRDSGPSRAIVGTAITLGVLIAALLVLALALSL